MGARRRAAKTATAFPPRARRVPAWLLLVALVAATLAAYQPAWHGDLLWDDEAHVTRPEMRSLEGLRRIWLEPGATQQYYPLLHSTFRGMHRLFGGDIYLEVYSSPTDPACGVPLQDACIWSAQTAAASVSILTSMPSNGDTRVYIRVAANSGAARTTTITVRDRTVLVRQAGL